MEAAARTFAELFPGRKKVLVLGDMYEMGEQSAHMHAGVGEALNDIVEHIELLVTVGEDTQHLHRAYNGNKLHVASKPEALAALLPLRDQNHAFLFKASRGMELWTLLTDLEQHE
ncbi:UDP-N-acetylmuramoyl-tripeptide--D-alanyl-D-alanine ligase, partial [Mesorhizobium sp. M00.F.Ca.ET.186.01.1.1]